MVVNKGIRDQIGKSAGATVSVTMDIDPTPQVVSIPPDLAGALKRNKKASVAFEEMAPSHRKAYARWIGEAKKPETRSRRVAKALEMIEKRRVL